MWIVCAVILPWDCAEWHDSVEKYFDVQKQMLTELLTNYGPIARAANMRETGGGGDGGGGWLY